MPFGPQPDVIIVFLSGSTEWIPPINFDPNFNILELVGGGAGGGSGGRQVVHFAGGGAGGGGYTKTTAFDPAGASTISFSIGEGGPGGVNSDGAPGGDTIWNTATTASVFIASGGFAGSKGQGGPNPGRLGFGGSGSLFNGGRGGTGESGQVSPGRGTGGGGGGSANASGSGRVGLPTGGVPSGGGGDPGDPIGFIFEATINANTASAGKGGTGLDGSDGGDGLLNGAGGAGGSRFQPAPTNGGTGSPGFIVLTYRSRIIELAGEAVDVETATQSGILQSLQSKVVDDDSLQGQLFRQLVLSGRAVDADVITGRPKIAFTLTGDVLDADVVSGRPVFSFSLVGELTDEAAIFSRFTTITSFRGTALDSDEVKAYLAKIHNFTLTIAGDVELAPGGAITIGLVEMGGTILDADILKHIIVPPRDIAFFVIRNPTAIHDGPVIDEGFTQPTTLHGFGLKNLVVDNMVFEIIPVNMKPEDDPTITIFMESD